VCVSLIGESSQAPWGVHICHPGEELLKERAKPLQLAGAQLSLNLFSSEPIKRAVRPQGVKLFLVTKGRKSKSRNRH
jgi:hypothetical protein